MRKLPSFMRAAIAILVLFTGLLFLYNPNANTAVQGPCPNPPPVVITSSQVPSDVCIPDGFPGNAIQFFDDYSWRSFIALVWPAQQGQRGMPDTTKTVDGPGPRVFETYKSSWEIFHADGSAPAAWNNYEEAKFNACNQAVAFGDVVLASFSKFGDIGQAGMLGKLVGPLVAQNMTYTRYLTGFNQIEFDQINGNKWYLRANLGTPDKPLFFQDGAIDVKSAWIDMTNIGHPERYYTRSAWVLDPATGQCSKKLIGLVGLHIVQKTPSRPQWIWSSFEHIDNIRQTGAVAPFTYDDGSGTAMPDNNPTGFPPPDTPTVKFNVQRLKPIFSPTPQVQGSTEQTNTAYRKALAEKGSVWQFYQLVMTQWPLQINPGPIPPSQPGTPDATFPGTGATTAFANLTMETFDQKAIRTGCMNCHNLTKAQSDFLWVLNTHSFSPGGPGILLRDSGFRGLKELLEVHRENEGATLLRMTRSKSNRSRNRRNR